MTEEIDLAVIAGSRNCFWTTTTKEIQSKINLEGNVWLRDDESDQLFPGYVYRIDEDRIKLFILINQLSRGQELDLCLSEDQPQIDPDSFPYRPVEVKSKSEEQIAVNINGKLFTNYYFNTSYRPFLMPLIGPYGDAITRQHPLKKINGQTEDHIHHRSCWTAWGEVNGVDNWSEGDGKGSIDVDKISIAKSGYALGHIQSLNKWMDPETGKANLEEKRDMFFYNSLGTERTIDFRIELTAISEDVEFGDTKEGGFLSVRVATSMDVPRTGKIQNAYGGFQEDQCWGKRAHWCDYSGVVNKREVGIAIFDHPENYNFPTYWHVRNYGLMAANPLALSHFLGEGHNGSLVLPQGDSLIFKYRLVTHAGGANEANLEEKYKDFVYPPEIKSFEFL